MSSDQPNTCIFSGYWPVGGNIKPTAGKGHLHHAEQKGLNNGLNFFISEDGLKISNARSILLSQNDLPSMPYINNLKKFCHTGTHHGRKRKRPMVIAKSGFSIPGPVYFNLQKIWASKVLLFRDILNYTNSFDSIIWRDCVTNINFKEIRDCPVTDKIIVNMYHREWNRPFRGQNQRAPALLSQISERQIKQWDIQVRGCVTRIPSDMVHEVCDLYTQCLQYIDSTFNIYDDEIVLSFMCNIYPEYFHIINRK